MSVNSFGIIHFFSDNVSTSFVQNEIKMLSLNYKKVNVYLLNGSNTKGFAANVEFFLFNDDVKKGKLLFNHFCLIVSLLVTEIIRWPIKISKFAYLRNNLSNLLTILSKYEELKRKNCFNKEDIYYSFWFNDWATLLSICRKNGDIVNFISRVHGTDLYEERVPVTRCIPFRKFHLKNVDKVFSVSKAGFDYLLRKYSNYKNKVGLSYLGTENHGSNPFNEGEIFTVVTCAHVRNIKRIYLLPDILQHLSFQIRWIHIGGENIRDSTYNMYLEGIEKLRERKNVEVVLKGKLNQEEVFELYKTESINLFLSVSVTEGLPVSMMEAISFGIPIMATDVGGCNEIVNSTTGMLIDVNMSPDLIAEKIRWFKDSEMNTINFHVVVREFWENNFKIENNFSLFKKEIPSVAS